MYKPGGHSTPGCKMQVQTECRSCTDRDHCTIKFILTVLAGSSPGDNMGWWILKLRVFINKRQGCSNTLWDWSVSSGWFKYILGAGQRVPVLLRKKGKKRLISLWLPNFSIWPVSRDTQDVCGSDVLFLLTTALICFVLLLDSEESFYSAFIVPNTVGTLLSLPSCCNRRDGE